MDLAEFRAEAERLARPATLLRANGRGDPSAYWHGVHVGKPCISVRRNGAWLNVHLDSTAGRVEITNTPLHSATPLFADAVTSLPPVDAIFLLGSPAIEAYLLSQDWTRTDPLNDNFPDDVPAEYERLYRDNCPLYSRNVVAVCGGWHFPWPDGDFADLVGSELIVWTFQDAEPWIEVFATGDAFAVKQRIT